MSMGAEYRHFRSKAMIWMQGIYSDERQLLADLDAMDLFALALPCWKRRPTWAEWDEVCGIRAIGDPELYEASKETN